MHVCVCLLLIAVVWSCVIKIWKVLFENSKDKILLSKYLNNLSLFALNTTINLYLVNDSAVNLQSRVLTLTAESMYRTRNVTSRRVRATFVVVERQ